MKEESVWAVSAKIRGDNLFREGARVWVRWLPDDPVNACCYGLSLGGRHVEKWVRTYLLSEFRPKHTATKRQVRAAWAIYATKEEAAAAAEMAERVAASADERAPKRPKKTRGES
jgi:hypothetical protein